MKIMASIVATALAMLIAGPAAAHGPRMMAYGRPMMRPMMMHQNYQAYPEQRSYGYAPQRRRFVFERRVVGYPAYGGGGAAFVGGAGYVAGGSFQSFHYHHAEFHERQVHVEVQHEMVREFAPAPIAHAYHNAPCYKRHAHVYVRPRVVARSACCCCCNPCGGAVAADPPEYRPSDPPDRREAVSVNPATEIPSNWEVIR
jgi:hypothetical protein